MLISACLMHDYMAALNANKLTLANYRVSVSGGNSLQFMKRIEMSDLVTSTMR